MIESHALCLMIESHALKCWTTALGDGGKSSKTARADGERAMGGGGRARRKSRAAGHRVRRVATDAAGARPAGAAGRREGRAPGGTLPPNEAQSKGSVNTHTHGVPCAGSRCQARAWIMVYPC